MGDVVVVLVHVDVVEVVGGGLWGAVEPVGLEGGVVGGIEGNRECGVGDACAVRVEGGMGCIVDGGVDNRVGGGHDLDVDFGGVVLEERRVSQGQWRRRGGWEGLHLRGTRRNFPQHHRLNR